MKHWSYRQRLVHFVSQSKSISWKDLYSIAKRGNKPVIKRVAVPKIIVKRVSVPVHKNVPKLTYQTKIGHMFHKTVNQKRLSKAVHAMYLRKQGKYSLSINKICKHFHISKPSLYRGYRSKYGK